MAIEPTRATTTATAANNAPANRGNADGADDRSSATGMPALPLASPGTGSGAINPLVGGLTAPTAGGVRVGSATGVTADATQPTAEVRMVADHPTEESPADNRQAKPKRGFFETILGFLLAPFRLLARLFGGSGSKSRPTDRGTAPVQSYADRVSDETRMHGYRPGQLRVMTYNVKRNRNEKEMEPLVRFFQDLPSEQSAQPDIILLQEVMLKKDGSSFAHKVAEKLGYYVVEANKSGKYQTEGGTGEGCAILSRFPIVNTDSLSMRSFELGLMPMRRLSLMAEVEVPGVGLVRASNSHLTWNGPATGQVRDTHEWLHHRDRTPADVTVVGGDFNKDLNSGSMKLLRDNYAYVDSGLPTRGNSPIDELFVQFADRTKKFHLSEETHGEMGSDHRAVGLDIDFSR